MRVDRRFLFLLPLVLAFAVAILAPIIIMATLSLFKTNFIFTKYVGLQNFVAVFQERKFLQAAGNTIFYAAIAVPAGTFLPLWAALTAHGMRKSMRNLLRFGMYLPTLASGIVMAGTWRILFDYRKGMINWLLSLASIDPVAWWFQRSSAIPLICGIIVITIWLGGITAMYMAVLNAIPEELYQAARVDGANWAQIQRHVLLPMIAPSIGFAMLIALINIMTMWEHIFLLTSGGPDGATATFAFHIYFTAFQRGDYGAASAQSLLLFFLVLGLALGREKIQRSFV